MSRLRVAVIMGGPSREHEVSLNSGQAVLENLDRQKYDLIQVVISKDEEWFFDDESTGLQLKPAVHRLKDEGAVAFLALHGNYGEDGTLQAVFDRVGVPYTGSGVTASDLAMDKLASNERYEANKLLVPKTQAFHHTDANIPQAITKNFALPVVVKPVREGSSVGVSIVKKPEDLAKAVATALDCDETIMVQEYIKGREVSCGVIQKGDDLHALPPTEIIPVVADFYSYEAKYADGGSDHITPAKLPDAIMDKVQENAIIAHHALGCKTYSRTDMIIKGEQVYLIETNTLPGLTKHSLLPEQAKVAGISFTELLDLIIAGHGV